VTIDLSNINFVVLLACLVIAITLHEAMHAFTSNWLGDDTALREGRLSLNPLKHVDPLYTVIMPAVTLLLFGFPLLAAKPVPFNPARVKYDEFGAALVGIAGPLTNLALAALGAIFLHGAGGQISQSLTNTIGLFVWLNLALFVFNMIPFPPLDGSRLLYAFAPEPVQKVMYTIESGGLMFFVVFIVLFISVIGPIMTNIISFLLNILGLQVIGV
jgi:Zn-dependent protease